MDGAVQESSAARSRSANGLDRSSDPRPQVRLLFDTREEAIAFAERNKLSYVVHEPKAQAVRPKSYAENFRS